MHCGNLRHVATDRAKSEDWQRRLTAVVAANVRRLRTDHKPPLSAQALSSRTAELGYPIHRTVIADLESGRRAGVTLADLFVLARALDAPPMALIAALDGSAEIPALPNEEDAWPTQVIEWIVGQRPSPWMDRAEISANEASNWDRNAELLLKLREVENALALSNRAIENLMAAPPGSPVRPLKESEATRFVDEWTRLSTELRRMVQERGGDPNSLLAPRTGEAED